LAHGTKIAFSLPTVKSILIADGYESVAELFAQFFARDGWTVTTYSDGLQAAEALGGSARYAAVLVSSRLYGMSGVELIRRIRALGHRKDVPIVMVTGTVDAADVTGALAAGADDVLNKPTNVASLVTTVGDCVERCRQQNT
jgi:DNA-binding response OmpR family regulator